MIDPQSIDLPRFLIDWYGPPSVRPMKISAEHEWLPDPLKEWFTISSQWTRPLIRMKRMIAASDLRREEGEKTVFMEDYDGDWFWSFDSEDPTAVFDAGMDKKWKVVSEAFPEFIIHNILNETVYGAASWRESTQTRVDLLERILAPMTAVSFGGWRWPGPGRQIFMGESLIAEVGPALSHVAPWGDRTGYAEVRVSATKHTQLDYLDRIGETKWIKYDQLS